MIYKLIHIKTGKITIVHSSEDYCKIIGHKDNVTTCYPSMWWKRGEAVPNYPDDRPQYYREWIDPKQNYFHHSFTQEYSKKLFEANERMNKFWEGVKDYAPKEYGKLEYSGSYGSSIFTGIRLVLKQIKNHAVMQKDLNTYRKAEELDKAFWQFITDKSDIDVLGSAYQIALPEHK